MSRLNWITSPSLQCPHSDRCAWIPSKWSSNDQFLCSCGIDLNEQQNIINLIGSLGNQDTESKSSVRTTSTISINAEEDEL